MRLNRFFLPTLREAPTEAEVPSHILLLRAGYIRQLAAGIYSYLPLAQRSLLKIQEIIRQEMNAIGGQEFYLPALHPAELWKDTGRWEVMGDNMFRLKDRWGRDMCLGMTHEEVFAKIAHYEMRSYKELPQYWYQIQAKFRDEPRPRSGLLRVRQFTMKDSYSFDLDRAGLDLSYNDHYNAYCRIFTRCGLEFLVVAAHSGAMGGNQSHEFMVKAEAGEDWVATCAACGYAANTERATSRLAAIEDEDAPQPQPVKVSTPGQKTIDEISRFLKVPGSGQIKTLIYMVESEPVLILMRGDHQLNEAKLESALATTVFRPALPEEIRQAMGADAGSLGPVGVKGFRIIADRALQGRKNMTTGANEDDCHIQGVTPGVHFQAEYFDLRTVQHGEGCPECDGILAVAKAIEVGHIFKLGTKYSEALNARVLDQAGNLHPILMGSYGIGVERILSSAAELYHDEHGMILPVSIAPFEVIVVPVSVRDDDLLRAAEDMYARFQELGVDVLLDDRDERAGVKFNDADLIGVPYRVTLGQKKLKAGLVELTVRRTGERTDIPLADAVARVAGLIAEQRRCLDDRAAALERLEGRA
ncbi:MAG: proline--tRNA ligase [Acidobacteria bacterium]|nr:proline--tRNA ligase [Acidobacteriota bacterium]